MSTTLVLYDTTGEWGWLGELYAMMVANLASHFGSWTALPVASYTAGKLNAYTAVVYIGSTYGEPLPSAFLNDVLATTKPVIWAYDNIWQLVSYSPSFSTTYGWMWSGFDTSSVAQVNYKGQQLKRYALNAGGIMNYSTVGSSVTVLANAVRSDGSTFPWALRSKNLTYIGENPLQYISEGDRYIAFCDLLFDALAPTTATRHRAMVRIEDINPASDPTQLRSIADYLASENVRFGFGVSPVYQDPLGTYNGGVAEAIQLRNAPTVISALQYLQSKGGVMIEHGWTHQYANVPNAYNAVSGDDFEFYRVTENSDHTLNYQGPVSEDSTAWTTNRINSAGREFRASGLVVPTIFEFPHYSGSAVDAQVVAQAFPTRYERTLYFSGLFSNGNIDYTRLAGQYFPYVVRDVYGSKVLPENLGSIEPDPFFQFPTRFPADIIADAQRNLVVRDGFASFFNYWDNDISYLKTTIQGIKSLGYTFVSPSSL
jgi:uncharacterized protein YdaL